MVPVGGSFFLGALSTVLIEFGRGQFERRQRKRDRLDDAERAALTELQDSVYEMIRAATGVIVHREGVLDELGEWRIEQKYTDPEPAAFMVAYTRAGILAVRVRDEPIRICAEALREVVDATKAPETPLPAGTNGRRWETSSTTRTGASASACESCSSLAMPLPVRGRG